MWVLIFIIEEICVMFKFFKFWTCSLIMAGGLLCFNNLSWAKSLQQELRSMPEGSYQLARSVFLPNAGDDIWLHSYDKFPNTNTPQKPSDLCSKQGYNLERCPINGRCSPCPTNSLYKKLTSCAEGYKISVSKTYCECLEKFCDKSEYFMMSCPEGTVCESCTEISSNCSKTTYHKPTTDCISGYCYTGGRCQKTQTKSCGLSYGPNPEWKDECPTGYICSQSGTYMTSDCQSGTCWRYVSCDNANDYYLSTSSPAPVCKHMPCYKTQTTCSGYPLASCPENGICSKCTITNKYCTESDTKYKFESCEAGYHVSSQLADTCEKDCKPNSLNGKVYNPIYKTKAECEAVDGVSSCTGAQFSISSTCSTGTLYYAASCDAGYKLNIVDDGESISQTCYKTCSPTIAYASRDGFTEINKPSADFIFEQKTYINNECNEEVRYKITGCKDTKKYFYKRFSPQCIQKFDYLYADYSISTELDCSKYPIGIIVDKNAAVSYVRTKDALAKNFATVAKEFGEDVWVGEASASNAFKKTKGNWSSGDISYCRTIYMYQHELNQRVNKILSQCNYSTTNIPKFTGRRACGYANANISAGKNSAYMIDFDHNNNQIPSYDNTNWTYSEYAAICGEEDDVFGNNCLVWQSNSNYTGNFFPLINYNNAK